MATKIKTLQHYHSLIEKMSHLFVDKVDVQIDPELKTLYQQGSKLVCLFNHGPMLGPLAYCFIPLKLISELGAHNRSHFAIVHRYFYKVPIIRQFMSYITQLDQPYRFEELVEMFRSDKFQDFYLMPEGDNCNFGNGKDIQPFRSPRFIELALLTQAPLLLVVQQGAEKWAHPIPLKDQTVRYLSVLPKALFKRIAQTKLLSIPTFPKKIPQLKVNIQVYRPKLSEHQLSTDLTQRKKQLWDEANRVRNTMQSMAEAL